MSELILNYKFLMNPRFLRLGPAGISPDNKSRRTSDPVRILLANP